MRKSSPSAPYEPVSGQHSPTKTEVAAASPAGKRPDRRLVGGEAGAEVAAAGGESGNGTRRRTEKTVTIKRHRCPLRRGRFSAPIPRPTPGACYVECPCRQTKTARGASPRAVRLQRFRRRRRTSPPDSSVSPRTLRLVSRSEASISTGSSELATDGLGSGRIRLVTAGVGLASLRTPTVLQGRRAGAGTDSLRPIGRFVEVGVGELLVRRHVPGGKLFSIRPTPVCRHLWLGDPRVHQEPHQHVARSSVRTQLINTS